MNEDSYVVTVSIVVLATSQREARRRAEIICRGIVPHSFLHPMCTPKITEIKGPGESQ